jgi:hypothetical protein
MGLFSSKKSLEEQQNQSARPEQVRRLRLAMSDEETAVEINSAQEIRKARAALEEVKRSSTKAERENATYLGPSFKL